MTTFISDSLVLAIPCFALAPNRLMLAVVTSPHGSVTTLSGAATLSQAHLIQPGRALGAEPQVRSSFREVLQLHMQLRVAPQSSSPTTHTFPIGGVGTRCSERNRVVAEIGIPRRQARRAPPSPLRANPMVWRASRKRVVSREAGLISSGRRSVNTLRGQAGLRQKNFRTIRRSRIGRPAQGRSAGLRR
jgi:hypothetical protein